MLNKNNIIALASKLNIEPALIYAIIKTESNGVYRTKQGIRVLFERHICYRLVKEKHGEAYAKEQHKKYPHLCNPRAGGYGKYSKQYKKLNRAIELFGSNIAYNSASYGAFQIMGFNHKLCGYESAFEMFSHFHYLDSEKNQFLAFGKFVENYQNGKLLQALKDKNWHEVARRYNGRNYKKNRYAEKLEFFYTKYSPQKDTQKDTL